MLTKADIEDFYQYVDSLNLVKRNITIAKATNTSTGTVSEYLNRRKKPSEAFIRKVYEAFPKSSQNVPRETMNGQHYRAELIAKDAEIIALLKDKVRQMEQDQANLSELHNDLEVMAEFQRAIVELFLAQSQQSGKAAYNKSLEVLRKRGLEGILSREGT